MQGMRYYLLIIIVTDFSFFFNAGLHIDSRIDTRSGLALCVQLARDIIVSLDIDYRSFLL